MSFKDHEVEVGMAIGSAVGSGVELVTAGSQADRQGGSLLQLAAGLAANGVTVFAGAPTGRTADFAMGDAKGFVSQPQTTAPQPAVAPKLERGFS